MGPSKLTIIDQNNSATLSESVRSGIRTLEFEAEGLAALRKAIGGELSSVFTETVETIRKVSGRVIVTGMGKSGHVGTKITATFASTGTPSFFVHPSEAGHGDLGMITHRDIVLALSWSGETAELASVIDFSRRHGVPLIGVSSNADSTLARAADIAITLPIAREACPHNLAPTTSSVMQLALGDALAIALLESRGFTASDFKAFHPGGKLGAQLTLVKEVMHSGDRLPLTPGDTAMSEALLIMTERSFGCLGITGKDGRLVGIITDGDLRRNMNAGLLNKAAQNVMTGAPKTVAPDTLVSVTLEILTSQSITALFVVDDGLPVGIVHIHDLLRIGAA
jgi:arabinose-5-phosphate isomerase